MQKLKTSRDMPKLTIGPLTRGLLSIRKCCFCHALQAKISNKQTFFSAAILHPLLVKVLKSEIASYHYFSSRIPTMGSGGKKTFKWYLKSEETDGWTNGRTDGWTFWLNPPRGPIQWKEYKFWYSCNIGYVDNNKIFKIGSAMRLYPQIQ